MKYDASLQMKSHVATENYVLEAYLITDTMISFI